MTSRLKRRYAKLAIVAILLATIAPTSTAFADDTATWELVTLQLEPPSQGEPPVMIITGTLPQAQALPASVRLAIPSGLQVGWAGEILGGPLENDPAVQPQVMHTDKGYDLATFPLSQSRIGQIELDASQAVVTTNSGVRSVLAWTPSDDVGLVRLGLMVPPGSQLTTFTAGAELQEGPSGTTLIFHEFPNATADQPLELMAEYTAPTGASGGVAGTTSGGGGSSSASTLVLVLLAGGLILVLVGLVRRGTVKTDAADDEPDDASREAAAPSRMDAPDTSEAVDTIEAHEPDVVTSVRSGRISPKLIILVSMIAIFSVVALVISQTDSPGSTRETDTYVERTFEFGSGNAEVTVPLLLTEGDPAHEADHVFEALKPVKGVKTASLMLFDSTLVVRYDSGVTTEEQVVDALRAAKYTP